MYMSSQSQPTNSNIRYRNNLVFSDKNMVYSTSDHKRKHYHIFLQNKNKEMLVLLIHHMKRPIQSVVRHLGWNFLRILMTVWARGIFLWEAAPKMFELVLNTPLILLKILSLYTICEGVYSNPSQAFGMDVSARIVGLAWRRVHIWCVNVYIFIL